MHGIAWFIVSCLLFFQTRLHHYRPKQIFFCTYSSASCSSTMDTRQRELDRMREENARLSRVEAETTATMRSISASLTKEMRTAKQTERRRQEISLLKRQLKKVIAADIERKELDLTRNTAKVDWER